MTSALVCCDDTVLAGTLATDLESVGIRVLAMVQCRILVREAVRLAPDVVVCWEDDPDNELFEAVQTLQSTDPRPVLVFTADPDADRIARAVEAGVSAYEVQGYGVARLRPLLVLAQTRHRHEWQRRGELEDLTRRFEERKLVDRAKGLLMRATQMSEEDAFRALRTASMHGNRRVGQVSRQVIDAARHGEALNRAGQMRMLSQRLVKLYALVASGTEAAGSAALLKLSAQRADDNLVWLGKSLSKPSYGDLLETVQSTWQRLQPALAQPAQATTLAALDEQAERLLSEAEQLSRVLETGGPSAPLHVINVAGRQRMLSQRLAKQALLAHLLGGGAGTSARADAARTRQDFEQALDYLRGLPLSSQPLQEALQTTAGDWHALLDGAQRSDTQQGRVALAAASEALLEALDRLTERYERSMQMLMG